jgi:hypothetical protein
MKLIESKTLGTAQASIEFTSIPQTFTDLVVLVNARAVSASVVVSGGLFLNSTASDTSWRALSGTGSSANSGTQSGVTDFLIGDFPAASATANTFGNALVYIPNYTGSQQKSLSSDSVSENNGTAADQKIVAGLCTKTAAITSLTVRVYQGGINLAAGSMVSLYGVLKGSDGIVTTTP